MIDSVIVKLKEYQYENRLTQVQIAKELGTHAMYISAICTGRRKPGPALYYRIVKLLGLSTKENPNNTTENKKHEKAIDAKIADDSASEICVTVKPQKKLIPKISHNLLHRQLQSKIKTSK